ncbi:MAG: hypothetical protein J6W24_06135 [Prevotella sp.]|nr:hypothetical protein [Prevotella sp.]
MKIKVTQLDERTRNDIAQALEMYAFERERTYPKRSKEQYTLATTIRQGELLLCEYVDNNEDKEEQV